MSAVTEEDALAFYDQNKAQINGDFASVKDQIIQYLTQLEQQKRETDFVQQLRKDADVKVYLMGPEPPFYTISTDDRPSRGNPQARVTLIEFTDYECPSCGRFHPVLEKILQEYGDRVRLVVRNFPLDMHQHAMKAAEASEAAREQGKYWEYIALLFENQSALGVENLKEYASKVGLDRQKFDQALSSGKFRDNVKRDIEDGLKVGVNGTPTLFLNGKMVRDRSPEGLKSAIEAALKGEAKKN
jgi:protein-disulfide isomerase